MKNEAHNVVEPKATPMTILRNANGLTPRQFAELVFEKKCKFSDIATEHLPLSYQQYFNKLFRIELIGLKVPNALIMIQKELDAHVSLFPNVERAN